MKKILIAFDGTQFSKGAFEFARAFNEIQPILLTGVFIPQLSYANLWSYAGAMVGPMYMPVIEEENAHLLDENIALFQNLCTEHNINYKVHKAFNDFALPELKRETRFADLLLISSEKFFENIAGNDPSEYMKDAIHEAECAVIVTPENFSFPKQNVIAYDGSASSVYAMKQFAYIFPELTPNDTLLVYSKTEDDVKLPNEDYIEELASQHFPHLSFLKLHLDPKKDFNNWLQQASSSILICGSFGRSSVSLIFRKSFVSQIIKDHKLPVFIAHPR